MTDGFKGQIKGQGKNDRNYNIIRLENIQSSTVQELKKAISRVPFSCDYEVRFRFPSRLFGFDQNDSEKNMDMNYNVKTDNGISKTKVEPIVNPVIDNSPNQKYNPDAVKYIEERIPFLTKNVAGFDESVETKDVSIFNRKWSFATKINVDNLKITFYDMYVQDKEGIAEWVSLSELFKVWIDNIFLNKVDGKYNSYSTVINYFNAYAIPKLELAQFSRRLEMGDIKNYTKIESKLNDKYAYNIFEIRNNQNFWEDFKNSTTTSLADSIKDIKNKFDFKNKTTSSIMLAVEGITKPINNLILGVALSSNIYNTIYGYATNKTEMVKQFEKDMKIVATEGYNEYLKLFEDIAVQYAGVPVGNLSGTRLPEIEDENNNTQRPSSTFVKPNSTEDIPTIGDFSKIMRDEIAKLATNEEFKKISGEVIQREIDKAKNESRPDFFRTGTAFGLDYVLETLGLISLTYSLYELTRSWVEFFYPPKLISPDWVGKPVLRFENGDVADAVIDFLIKNEMVMVTENSLKTGLPINKQNFDDLKEDGRFQNAQIMNVDMVQDFEGDINIFPIKTFIFYDIYPISIAYNSFDYDKSDELTSFTVTFKFTHFEQK